MKADGDLVGRSDEVEQLDRLLTALRAGCGGTVWIEGEPGIGKSALISTVRARAGGCQTFLAVGDEFTQRLPLRALLDCLDPGVEHELVAHGPDGLPPSDPVPAMVERLLSLVDRLCVAAPVLLAFDDLQWADETSLLVWRRLCRTAGQMPLLLVAARRPVPGRPALVRLRRIIVAEGALVVPLGPLPADAVDAYVARLAGGRPGPALRRVAGGCGGNPLYVRELVDALVRERLLHVDACVAELTDGVDPAACSWTAAIAARLDFLSADTNRVLRIAALLGIAFSVTELALVAHLPVTTLVALMDEALAAGVLSETGKHLAFRHALIRQALYRTTPAAARAAIHGQVVRALVRSGAPIQRVAAHLLHAPDVLDGWALGWLSEHATELAHRVPQLAVELLQRATERCDPAQWREQLHVGLANALLLLRRLDDAEHVARRAQAATRDPHRMAALTWIIALALIHARRHQETVPVLEQALARPGLAPVWRARLRALRAYLLTCLGQTTDGAEQAREVLADGERLCDRNTIGHALLTMYMCSDYQTCLPYLDRALAEVGDDVWCLDLRVSLLMNRATVLEALGDLDDGDKALREALILAEQRVAWRLPAVRISVGWCYLQRGRWDDAWAELQLAGDVPTVLDQVIRLGAMAFLAVHRDERTVAAGCLRAADRLPPLTHFLRSEASQLWMARAVRAEQRGDAAGAAAVLAHTVRLDDRHSLYDRHLWLPELVRLALAVPNRDLACAAVAAAEADAAAEPLPMRICAARRARAILDGDAATLLCTADSAQILGPLDRGQTYEEAAVLLAQTGEVVRARTALTEAVRCYLALGARWDIRRADARLRRYGIRRGPRAIRRRPTTGWAALTVTEEQVAALVAEGRSNPDIAAEMLLSRRTVQMHVSNILAKLGYRSRIDIAREAVRRAGR
jgi:DNA-binding CsgD family transcriptional regulator